MYHVFSSNMLVKNTLPVTCSSSSTCAMQKITRIFLSHVHGFLMWKNVFYFRHFARKTVELWRVANCGVKPGTNKTTKTILAKPSKRKKTNSKCRKKMISLSATATNNFQFENFIPICNVTMQKTPCARMFSDPQIWYLIMFHNVKPMHPRHTSCQRCKRIPAHTVWWMLFFFLSKISMQ